jgi:hypothetical protein
MFKLTSFIGAIFMVFIDTQIHRNKYYYYYYYYYYYSHTADIVTHSLQLTKLSYATPRVQCNE